jgi:hypothetical protein
LGPTTWSLGLEPVPEVLLHPLVIERFTTCAPGQTDHRDGPDYTEPANLDRLCARGLSHKRSLAVGEYALGWKRWTGAPSATRCERVHQCVFAVLALESEPVDPRL